MREYEMQCSTKETLLDVFSTPTWQRIASEIIAYTTEHIPLADYFLIQEYRNSFPHALAHYKHCVLLYSEHEYTLHIAHSAEKILRPYSQESDTILYDDIVPEQTHHIPPYMYAIIPTKTIYSIIPTTENTSITAIFFPYSMIMQGDATVEIQCFSLLHSFMPINATEYPILSHWTLYDIIDSLGLEHDVVRIVFVDNKATHKNTRVTPHTKITLFPGIGGG